MVGKQNQGRWERRGTSWGFQSAATMWRTREKIRDSRDTCARIYTHTHARIYMCIYACTRETALRFNFAAMMDSSVAQRKEFWLEPDAAKSRSKDPFVRFSTLPGQSPRDFFLPNRLSAILSLFEIARWNGIIIDMRMILFESFNFLWGSLWRKKFLELLVFNHLFFFFFFSGGLSCNL